MYTSVIKKRTSFAILLIFLSFSGNAQKGHDFLHDKYDQLHESPVQLNFRKLAPVPAGVVYIQRPGEGEEEIREHFRTMKKLGFTNLKQIMPLPDWNHEEIQLIALEEGLIPWWFAEGGWEPITDELIKKLGIPKKTSMYEVRRHPKMIAYQNEVLKDHIKEIIVYKKAHDGEVPKGGGGAYDPTVGGRGLDLSDKGKELFVEWAKETYGDIENLNHAYNQHHHGLATGGEKYRSWEDFNKRWEQYSHREMRILRDIMRFKADYGLKELKERAETFHDLFSKNIPVRAGGELGLFRPHAYFGVDFPGIADVMKDHGSFYPSIHFMWHFDQVQDELGPTWYMQSSYMNDMFKGGWSGGWEVTGGPQQFGGEKFGQYNKGFTVDAGEMQQFTLSMLAAGFKGWGLWSWSVRSAGAEVGEYALLDHHNEVTDRAVEVGKIARGMQKYREELWEAHKEPMVGVLFDWDNEAMWSALSIKGQDSLRFLPMQSRVGISRALINGNVPYEYLNPDDLNEGLAARYPVIYMPGIIALNKELLPILSDYVKDGGRLVMDMPGGWMDTYSALLPRGSGSAMSDLFGTVIREYQYAGINRDWKLQGQELTGSIGSLRPEGAEIITSFENGKPAVTEHKLGKGTAVILGYEAARACFKPGNEEMEDILRAYTLGELESPYQSDGAIVYRLAHSEADHYFLLNRGEEKEVELNFDYYRYKKAEDVASGETISVGGSIPMEANSGRWIRFEK
jgi:beta-galactosidase